MTDEETKRKIAYYLDDIYYNKCKGDYVKYVQYIEKLEKNGKIKSEYIPREHSKNIWNETEPNGAGANDGKKDNTFN